MKTPREILLAQHQAVASKLDAIRREVVESTRRPPLFNWPILLWHELVWPCRHVWAGLAAIWVVILAVDFSDHDTELVAGKSPPPTREMILTFRQQERLLTELIGPNEPQAVAAPKPFLPRPSSERQFEILKA